MFIAHEPQTPSLHDLLKVKEGSISFLIFINASKTIGPHFGTLDIIPGTGILMNNEGIYFDLLPKNGPNYPIGGKLSQHDMSPVIIFKNSEPVIALGTPGGTGITQTTAQLIQKILLRKYLAKTN